ncbi:MAG: DUF362 domain-containing protein [Ignavibacteriales bacterium]|nr:DUF362 domain-containing protein [Ignavibacteriales bacterium]
MKLPIPLSPTKVTGFAPVDPTVVVLKTTPATVLDDIQRAMEMGGVRSALNPKSPTILKDNISWHFPFPAANTTPWQLEGTILGLRNAGMANLVCVQNKTVVTDAFKGEDLNKYVPLFRKYNIPVKFNFKEEDMKWVEYKPKTPLLVLDQIYPEGIRLPEFFFGTNIVHLPTVKCHIYTTTTGAMKNAFGGLLSTYRHYTHSWIHETLVDLLAIQREIHTGLFAVMDGTTVGNGPGPRTMYPVEKNLILAGADQVAIDAVAAKMMGFDPMSIPYIRLAHERGLGCGDPRLIKVLGEDVSNVNWKFSVGDNVASLAGDLLWFSPLRKFQNLLFRTPLVNLFIFGSEAYHDYYRWPLMDRRVFKRWLKSSQWGELFASYEPRGTR